MNKSIAFDKVADLYDFYVNVDFDVPFFLKEAEGYTAEILELMCGTGRVSIPLLQAGHQMTCVDYSKEMLSVFQQKIADKNYKANLVEMDATKLLLNKTFGLILLPFHSLSEILSFKKQQEAIRSISSHLDNNGTFILTLQNPKTRLKQADGNLHVIGEFPVANGKKMELSYTNHYLEEENIVTGHQFYEIYDVNNRMVEKRTLEINFRPTTLDELRFMVSNTDMQITDIFGDYSYNKFDEDTSNFIICRLKRRLF